MIINDKEILNILVTGKFQGLDLATPLYLGGHPKVSDLGYGQGFIGWATEVLVQAQGIRMAHFKESYAPCADWQGA